MSTVKDYVRCSGKLGAVIGPHVVSLLRAGVSVVLDFPANTRAQRRWMRDIVDESGAQHRLHFLDVSDEVCLSRMLARQEAGEHPFSVTQEQFWQVSRFFERPAEDEGFHIIMYSGADLG